MKVVNPFYFKLVNTPHQLFLATPHRSWSYLTAEQRINEIIATCFSYGIKGGDRVAIWAQNQPDYIFWLLALTRLQAVSVCLNTRLSKLSIVPQLADINVKYVVTDEPIELHDIPVIRLTERKTVDKSTIEIPPVLSLDEQHSIFFSSGTTGLPKAIPFTLANHYFSALGVISRLSISPSDQGWLLCLPLFHVAAFAIIWRCLLSGLSMVLTDRFDAEQTIGIVQQQSVGLVSLVPTMLVRILDHPSFNDSLSAWQSLAAIMVGGAPLGKELQDRCLSLGLPIVPSYGLTEASSTVTTATPKEWQYKPRSSGKPIPNIEVKIVDKQINIKGRTLFAGQTDWFNTKDVGYLDEEGYLFVTDRIDNMIICGGENIYPAEIETVLLQHPAIQDVCVLGVDDREWGQIPLAVVVAEQPIDLPSIKEFCLSLHLPSYKVPKQLVRVESIPKTSLGKTDRSALKQLIFDRIVT
jgi:O-succinylbenzoic acid--CoA ligase